MLQTTPNSSGFKQHVLSSQSSWAASMAGSGQAVRAVWTVLSSVPLDSCGSLGSVLVAPKSCQLDASILLLAGWPGLLSGHNERGGTNRGASLQGPASELAPCHRCYTTEARARHKAPQYTVWEDPLYRSGAGLKRDPGKGVGAAEGGAIGANFTLDPSHSRFTEKGGSEKVEGLRLLRDSNVHFLPPILTSQLPARGLSPSPSRASSRGLSVCPGPLHLCF